MEKESREILQARRSYVSEQLALILGVPVAPSEEQVDSFWQAFSLQQEESALKDHHGNTLPKADPALEQPPLHAEVLAWQRTSAKAPLRWPHGSRFAACLTHDVDRIVKLPWRERWRQMTTLWGKSPSRQQFRWAAASVLYAGCALCGQSDLSVYDPWMTLEKQHGFHSTFFVLPAYPMAPTTYDHYYRYGDHVRFLGHRMTFTAATRKVREAGWEIGLHGSYMSAVNATFFRKEKAQVEEMLAAPITSTRQHFLRFNMHATPGIQAQAGIQTDSTVGYSSTIGCRAGLAFPYFWPMEPELLEVPLLIQDVGLAAQHGGDIAQRAAIAHAQTLIRHVADMGGVVCLSWHTHPEASGAAECYRALLETVAELGGWGCSLGELNDWWRARRQQLRAAPASAETTRIGSTEHIAQPESITVRRHEKNIRR